MLIYGETFYKVNDQLWYVVLWELQACRYLQKKGIYFHTCVMYSNDDSGGIVAIHRDVNTL